MASLKRDQLVAQVNRVESVKKNWEDADIKVCKTERFLGKEWKVIPADLVDEFDALFLLCKTIDVEPNCRALVLAVESFQRPVATFIKTWVTDKAAEVSTVPPTGTEEMWQNWAKVLKEAHPKPRQLPLAPRIQLARGYNPAQVARSWGFKNARGEADVQAMYDAMEAGWENFDTDSWQSPSDKIRQVETDKLWGPRCEEMRKLMAVDEKDRLHREGKAPRVVPSIEELCALPGMKIEQIARMHRTDIDEIRAYMNEHGLTVEASEPFSNVDKAIKRADKKVKKNNEIRKLEDMDDHPELVDNFEDRVMAILEDGLTPKETAELLTYHMGVRCTAQQVGRIKSRWAEGRLPPEKPVSEPKQPVEA
jgi:hypothetical protein